MAEWTGLEPATSGVTGRRSNQLNYHSEDPIPAPERGRRVGAIEVRRNCFFVGSRAVGAPLRRPLPRLFRSRFSREIFAYTLCFALLYGSRPRIDVPFQES